MEIIYIGNICS